MTSPPKPWETAQTSLPGAAGPSAAGELQGGMAQGRTPPAIPRRPRPGKWDSRKYFSSRAGALKECLLFAVNHTADTSFLKVQWPVTTVIFYAQLPVGLFDQICENRTDIGKKAWKDCLDGRGVQFRS